MAVDSVDLLSALQAMTAAEPDYTKAVQYAHASNDEKFADQRLRRALERTGVDFRLNFCNTVIKSVVDRLEINGFTGGTPEATKAIRAIWVGNEMDLEAPEVHASACERGDAYIIAWPTEPADDSEEIGPLELNFNTADTVRLIYDEENPRKKKLAIKRFALGKRTRVNLYYADRIEKYISTENTKGAKLDDWEQFDDGSGEWPTPNPFGEIPVFHFRTARPYGLPEHRYAYGPQDAISKIQVAMIATLDHYGSAHRWALLGTDPEDMGADDASAFGFNDIDDDNEITGPVVDPSATKSQIGNDPGKMSFLRGVKSVGQFDPSDVSNYLNPLDKEVRYMALITGTPTHSFDLQGDVPSGESLRVAEAPLIKKVRHRQLSFRATWREVFTFCLRVMNISSNLAVDVSWATPASNDDIDLWQVTEKKAAMIGNYYALIEQGYTAEKLTEYSISKTGVSQDDQMKRLVQLGQAVMGFAQAVATQAMTAEQVNAIIAPLIAQDINPPGEVTAA